MRILTLVVFYPMLWLRGLVLVLGRFVSGLARLTAVLMVLASIFTRHRLWLPAGILALVSFFTFLLLQIYDSILFRLNPTGRTLILYE